MNITDLFLGHAGIFAQGTRNLCQPISAVPSLCSSTVFALILMSTKGMGIVLTLSSIALSALTSFAIGAVIIRKDASESDDLEAATAAGVSELVLTSHDPGRTDDQIDEMVEAARAMFPSVEAARPGMVMSL